MGGLSWGWPWFMFLTPSDKDVPKDSRHYLWCPWPVRPGSGGGGGGGPYFCVPLHFTVLHVHKQGSDPMAGEKYHIFGSLAAIYVSEMPLFLLL